jgi:hypothetical protein
MYRSGYRTARIEFRASTRDLSGQITHHPGEVVVGEVLAQKQDFLLVRTISGAQMYVDTSRLDLYHVELERAIG